MRPAHALICQASYAYLPANREGLSPLHEAAIKGNVDVIGFFLNQGGNPNSKSPHGETPLHFAVVSSNEEAVRLLLSKGADPDAAAERGTPREISKKLRLNKIEQLIAAVPPKAGGSSGGIKTLGSSGSIGSSTSSIGSKQPSAGMSPPPDLPPPPPPGPPDEQGGERASYALDEGALNDLITKISEPDVQAQPERSVERQSKPLPAPPNKNKTPSFTPAAVQQPSPETRASGKDGHGELNDLLDELDFGVRNDPPFLYFSNRLTLYGASFCLHIP